MRDLEVLRMEHDKWPAIIAGLRRQIKDTKEALEMDYDVLQKVQCIQTQTPARVRLGASAPESGRVKFGAGVPMEGLPLPLSTAAGDHAGGVEEPKHEASVFSGIASLRKELAHARAAHDQCGAAVADKKTPRFRISRESSRCS